MKVIVSLTSIPSRFDKLPAVMKALTLQACHEVWLNVPVKYNRFPEWDGKVPVELLSIDPKIKVNVCEKDYGPATKFLGPASKLGPEDLIVYVDDDTIYDPKLVLNLMKWHKVDSRSAWGLSGFNFESYFQRQYPRQHGQPVDVLEGYGGVIVKAGWIQGLEKEFAELAHEAKFADDVIVSNLLEKTGKTRKTVFTPECNVGQVQQYDWGFGPDALHNQVEGGHHANYRSVLDALELKGKNYFNYK